jgi:hypothetical protein
MIVGPATSLVEFIKKVGGQFQNQEGQARRRKRQPLPEERHRAGAAYSRKHGHTADAEKIAIRLWTFVHGASSLELDGDYERVAHGLNVHDLIADVTPKLLGAASEGRAPRGKKR